MPYTTPSKLFTIKTIDVVICRLHEVGVKLQCEEWPDSEFITMNEAGNIVDENGIAIEASVLVNNSIFNWRVLK
jgi:hypothetical protein